MKKVNFINMNLKTKKRGDTCQRSDMLADTGNTTEDGTGQRGRRSSSNVAHRRGRGVLPP